MSVTRYIGTCPVCERQQRLHKMRMVHHGYRRPGTGEIEGDCFGVGYPPYELSSEGTEDYLEKLLGQREHYQDFLRRLEAGEVRTLHKDVSIGRFSPPKMVTLTPADGYDFDEELRSRIRDTRYYIRGLDTEIARCERLIKDWVKRPVRTIEEEAQELERLRVEREAAREELRAARRSKREALDAKNRQREEERLALMDEYRRKFNDLAFEADAPGVQARAQSLWEEMHRRSRKKAYLRFQPWDLGIDAALAALKLAAPSATMRSGFRYAYDSGYLPPR